MTFNIDMIRKDMNHYSPPIREIQFDTTTAQRGAAQVEMFEKIELEWKQNPI